VDGLMSIILTLSYLNWSIGRDIFCGSAEGIPTCFIFKVPLRHTIGSIVGP